LLGPYDRAGKLVFAGKAGTGFSLKLGRELVERLRKIERTEPPFASVPGDYLSGSRWAEPRLVAELAYGKWTIDSVMRHPKCVALREDKPVKEVRLEQLGRSGLSVCHLRRPHLRRPGAASPPSPPDRETSSSCQVGLLLVCELPKGGCAWTGC
jgi:hypothetical protein